MWLHESTGYLHDPGHYFSVTVQKKEPSAAGMDLRDEWVKPAIQSRIIHTSDSHTCVRAQCVLILRCYNMNAIHPVNESEAVRFIFHIAKLS